MQQPVDLVTKAGKLIVQAQEAESREDLRGAYSFYEDALVILQSILQNKQNKYLATAIAEYSSKCVDRAQYIRDLIECESDDTPRSSVSTESRSSSSKRKTSREDNEKDHMLQDLAMTCIDPANINVSWNDIVGMLHIKEMLHQAIEMPRDFPHLFTGNRSPTRSVLFYGPPGTGKTLLGKAVACSSGMPFFSVSSAELISKFVGESEKYVKAMFEMVKKRKPCVLFIDEIESLCAKREESKHTQTVAQFLVQLDGISMAGSMQGVFLIGCTNLPWQLDDAMIRRLEKRIYVPLPTVDERQALIEFYFKKDEHSITAQEFRELALLTEYFSAADITQLAKSSAMIPLSMMREATHFEMLKDSKLRPCNSNHHGAIKMTLSEITDKSRLVLTPITYTLVLEALESTKSTVDIVKLKEYESWTTKHGQ